MKKTCALLLLILLLGHGLSFAAADTASDPDVASIMQEIVLLTPEARADLLSALVLYTDLADRTGDTGQGAVPAVTGTADFQTYEGPGWASPEEAVQLYLEGFKAQNPRQMLQAFAIETYVRHFDFAAQLERSGGFNFTANIRLPNLNEAFITHNIESRRQFLYNYIFYQFMTLMLPETDIFIPVSVVGAEKLEEFLASFEAADVTRFETITLEGFVDPADLSEPYLSHNNQKNLKMLQAIYGADDLKSMVAQITIDGQDYLFCCDVLRYGDAWYLSSLGGSIGNYLGIEYVAGGLMPVQ